MLERQDVGKDAMVMSQSGTFQLAPLDGSEETTLKMGEWYGAAHLAEELVHTGGKGSITQQVHGEFMVSSETICSHFTQWVHAGYFLKVPTNSPSKNPPGKV